MPTDAVSRRPVEGNDRPPRRRTRPLAASEKGAGLILLALVFLAVVAFGASDIAVAILLPGLYALYLIGLLVTCAWARRDLARTSGLGLQVLLFALLTAAVLWPLSPWGPGGAHPVWAYVTGQAGSLTVDRSALLLNVLQLFGLACLFVSARVFGASETRGLWFVKVALAALGVYAAVALTDHVAVRRTVRLTATLLSPNSAATVFGAASLLTAAAVLNRFRRHSGLSMLRRGDPEAMAWLGLLALFATTLLMTVSRAGVAATLVGLALLLVWNVFAQRQSPRAVAGLAGLAAIVLLAAVALRSADQLAGRFAMTGRDVEIRSAIFAAHWHAFLSTPWSGFGLGSFPTVNQLIVDSATLPVLYDIRAVHNLYLQWLEEAGIVGFTAMLVLFLSLLLPIARGGFQDSTTGAWARATACAAVVFLVHGATDFALQVPAIQALCVLMLGVIGGLSGGRSRQRGAPSPALSRGVTGVAAFTVAATALVSAPLIAARAGGDLSAWPTAPAEALAEVIETGLASRPNPAALARLERISDRELALRPASGAAWLRRAAVEAASNDDLAASKALQRSFQVAPLQTSLFDRRTIFAYEHWDRLSPAAREDTVYHVKVEWRRSGRPARFVAMANSLHNPAGRVGMALQIALLRLSAQQP